MFDGTTKYLKKEEYTKWLELLGAWTLDLTGGSWVFQSPPPPPPPPLGLPDCNSFFGLMKVRLRIFRESPLKIYFGPRTPHGGPTQLTSAQNEQ